MRAHYWAAVLMVAAGTWPVSGQTAVDLSRQGKVGTGTVLPVRCTVGQIFFKTDAPVGTNLFACTSTDTWTAVGLPALGGDAGGTQQSVTVRALQGRNVSASAPADQNVLRWNASTGQWEPAMAPNTGTAAPPATCAAGSLYLRSDTTNNIQQLYVCLSTNVWAAASTRTGTAAGRPANCVLGQTWLATDTGAMTYCSVTGNPGTWSATLAGPQGPAGTNGNTILSGTGAPSSGTGANGDFYLNTSASCLYGPKASGAWPGSCTSLVGPQGPAGSAPAWTTVSFSATPTFAITNPIQGFQITLTGNVTSSSFSGSLAAGQMVVFKVCENATGGYTFAPPANVVGFGSLDNTASVCNTQTFQYDGSKVNAITPMRSDNASPRVSAVNGVYPLPSSPTTLVGTTDSRLSDARTPSAHATSHKNGGTDEVATATPGANAIPKAGSSGKLAIGWVASGTPDGTKFVRDDGTLATPAGGTGGNGSSEKSVAQCGVVGDGSTDDTAALNTCIANLPDYGTLIVPLNFRIKVTSKIKINGKYGFRIKGETSGFGGPSMGTQAPAIIWAGADGGTVLEINNSENGLIDHLSVFSSPAYGNTNTGAGTLISVDQVPPNSPVSTNLTFDYMALIGNQWRTDFNGILFSPTSQGNVEHMTVSNSVITCSGGGAVGTGIHLGPSYNAIAHLYQHNSITNCYRGIWEELGSGNVVDNQFNLNVIHMEIYPILPVQVVRNDSENCNYNQPAGTHDGAFLTGNGNMTIGSNRIANCHPGGGLAPIRLGIGLVRLTGNHFDPADEPGITGSQGVFLTSEGNSYPTSMTGNPATTVAGFRTFNGFTSQWDGYGDDTGPYSSVSRFAGNFMDGIGKLFFDKESEKWQVQERGISGVNDIKQAVVPYLTDSDPGCSPVGPARLGAFVFNPTADTTAFKFCGKKGGSYGWIQPVVPLNLDRNIPTSTTSNNVVDLGTFQFIYNWGATFDIYIQGVGTGATDYTHKAYRFTVGAGQSNLGWFRVNPLSQTVPAVNMDYDLEAIVIGSSTSFRLRKTASNTGGTWHTTILGWGTSGFTESTAVNTDTTPPAQFLGDTTLSQVGGKAVLAGDLKLQGGVHITTAGSSSDTAGLITVTNPSTSQSLTFAKPFAAPPVCVLTPTSDQLAAIASFWVTTSATSVTANVHTTPGSSISFAYHCFGNPN